MCQLSETQRAVLQAVCDTVVPTVEQPHDPDGFFARSASQVGVPQAIEQALAAMPEEQRVGPAALLDALAGQGFLRASHRSREQLMRNVALFGPAAAAGIGALTLLSLFFHYGLPDERGQNPNWRTLGYPGPAGPPPERERPLHPLIPEPDTVLEADVCIVGSGAGGGVLAGELSARGLHVVVLEAGGYFDDADFTQLELPAYQNLYWRGGPTTTADMNVSLQAGGCVAAARSSTGQTLYAPRPGCGSSGSRSTGWRGWPAASSSATSTRSGSDWASTETARS